MKLDLKKKANHPTSIEETIYLEERLPSYVSKGFELKFNYEVQSKGEFYLLKINERADVPVYCQRCMKEFIQEYHLETELAVCPNEQIAEKYQSLYDVIVASDLIVDLKEILIDNCHLFLPQFHQNIEDCDQNQLKLMQFD